MYKKKVKKESETLRILRKWREDENEGIERKEKAFAKLKDTYEKKAIQRIKK